MTILYTNGWTEENLPFPLFNIDIGHYPHNPFSSVRSWTIAIGLFGIGVAIIL